MTADNSKTGLNKGIALALLSAVLFGLSAPFGKILLGQVDTLVLPGLFYLGSGLGLTAYWLATLRVRRSQAPLRKSDVPWLISATCFGGVAGPLFLMMGLSSSTASSASLLLNFEAVFTALIAWVVFKENADARIILGMMAITLGGAVLAFTGTNAMVVSGGSLLVVLACLCWAIDNNLTRNISAADPMQVAAIKGLVGGSVNLALWLRLSNLPQLTPVILALIVGFFCYGVSLVLFVTALRYLGTARTSAYFSVSPFIGAIGALALLHELPTVQLGLAAVFMTIGLWLHLTEDHSHSHAHDEMEHEHEHTHDEHHQHEHGPDDPVGEPHSHRHQHAAIVHSHPHYPDLHHRHEH